MSIVDILRPAPRERDQGLWADLLAGSAAVEEGLLTAVKSAVPFMAEPSACLLGTGRAWRLRPLLVLLAARFGDPHAPGVVPAAVAVELTYCATLGHDGVRDAEPGGRSGPAPGALTDTSVALLTGDFLLARAAQILADLGPDAVRVQMAALERVVTGQILARTGAAEGGDRVAHRHEVAAARTGSLTGVAGRLGALAAGAGDPAGNALARYGERLGTALGLTDDALGAAGESPLGAGAHGESCPPPGHPTPRRALRHALRRARQARAALKRLPDCAARDALAGLCDAAAQQAGGSVKPTSGAGPSRQCRR